MELGGFEDLDEVTFVRPQVFDSEPHIVETVMVPVRRRWICPKRDCHGEMTCWDPMVSMAPGSEGYYHHQCDKCGFHALIKGKYPSIEFRER